ncbi:MAG: sugar phosphate isomerase/epimerase [Chitinophagaceae bacterium]|nr:MAG: sugar phosphate isomerase/epimerase [Chitinophagaceae bacterium]
MQNQFSRRHFIKNSIGAGMALTLVDLDRLVNTMQGSMRMGLVTYQWGKDWDLPTLIANCEKTGFLGVELRTQRAHKVESDLNKAQRAEVKKRFADSRVTCIGYGSNYEYHSPDAAVVRKNIEDTKEYIVLCQDIGATGLKVKPNYLPPDVPKEKTIAQIAKSLNECGKFAGDHGQLIRVEVHGQYSQEIPNMKAIFEQVTDKNVKMCWNSNKTDLLAPGLEANFNSVRKYFGDTVHVTDLKDAAYPFQTLINLFTKTKYDGWILLEAHDNPADLIAAMNEQLSIFKTMLAKAKKAG